MIRCQAGFSCVLKIDCNNCNPFCNPIGNQRNENVVSITCAVSLKDEKISIIEIILLFLYFFLNNLECSMSIR